MLKFYGIMCKLHFTLPEIKAASWIIKWFYMIIKVRSQIAKNKLPIYDISSFIAYPLQA